MRLLQIKQQKNSNKTLIFLLHSHQYKLWRLIRASLMFIMDHYCLLVLIVALTMMTNSMATSLSGSFEAIAEGETVEGSVVKKISVRSQVVCSVLCITDPSCTTYKFNENDKKCVLIDRSSPEKQLFIAESGNRIYQQDYCSEEPCGNNGTCSNTNITFVCFCEPDYTGETCQTLIDKADISDSSVWVAPPNWPDTIGSPVFYHGFEDSTGIILYPTATGNEWVGSHAMKTNMVTSKWGDFGTSASAACIVKGDCPNGGSLSVWLRATSCGDIESGFISSHIDGQSGFVILCSSVPSMWRHMVFQPTGALDVEKPVSSGWNHLVMSFQSGSNLGLYVYINGVQVGTDTVSFNATNTVGAGKLVIGRKFVNLGSMYSSVEVDELTLFNHLLEAQEASYLYNQYNP